MGLLNSKPKYRLEIIYDENSETCFCGYDFCTKHILGDKVSHFVYKNQNNNKWIYYYGAYNEIYNLWFLDEFNLEKKGVKFNNFIELYRYINEKVPLEIFKKKLQNFKLNIQDNNYFNEIV
tara:strand:- start:537 stop:899 length:363 start_codon:yes stop_codon:yes gene_type:complete